MSKKNIVEHAIKELEGGAFQKLFDAYLFKKYKFENIQTLGVQTGTNKPTKGTPDSYVVNSEGKYTLICYGSVEHNSFNKIKSDILACFDKGKLNLDESEISKIICGHSSTNLHIEQYKELISLADGIEIVLIGIDTLSADLVTYYPSIAKDYLGIAIDTHQIFDIEDFVIACDKSKMNAPIGCNFHFREKELAEINDLILKNEVTVIMGPSGIGKTRLVLESCRYFYSNGWQVKCVKSNSNSLYDDLRITVEQSGRYLIYFDDANLISDFEGILDYLLSISDERDIKIVLTVRDYARLRVIETVNKYIRPALYILKSFTDDEIKDILTRNLGIDKEMYLNRIASISNGNVRLAMLAGIKFVENGSLAINNAEDIFKSYYQEVFNKADLSKEELLLLLFLEVAGPVLANSNELFNALSNRFLIGFDVNSAFEKLNNLELIDWFKNEVAKTSDQSFGNYVVYHTLYHMRWIKLVELIQICMPKYRDRIVYVINTLLNIFNSNELKEYVETQIKEAWKLEQNAFDLGYLESFYQVDPIRALFVIKKYIDREGESQDIITDEEFNKKKNYNSIENKEIKILAGYKYMNNFPEAIDLLMVYYNKRPDLFMDFYHAITNELLYDKYSGQANYSKERLYLLNLWNRCDNGRNANYTRLFIRVADYALKTEISFTEEGKTSRRITICRMGLALTDGLKSIRKMIWTNLFLLRERMEYKKLVDEILWKKHVNGLYEDATKELVLFDFNCVYDYINKKIDYTAAKIISNYKHDLESLKMPYDARCERFKENEQFRIFDLLREEYIPGLSYEKVQAHRKKRIISEISKYTTSEYDNFFRQYNSLYQIESHEVLGLSSGILIVFENLEGDREKYLECFKLFLEYGGHLQPYYMYRIVGYVIKNIGYKDTKATIEKAKLDNYSEWMYKVWECIDEDEITEKIASDFFKFVKENNIIPSAILLIKYNNYQRELLSLVSDRAMNDKHNAQVFIGMAHDEDNIAALLELYKGNIQILCKIYVNALNSNMDYDGTLFKKLYNRYPDIWKQYVLWLNDNISYDSYEQNMIEVIWESEEYDSEIEFAFNSLTDSYWFNNDIVARLLFSAKNHKGIEKKKQWLLEHIRKNYNDIDTAKKLTYMVVIAFPDWRIEYILEFLKYNKSIEDFKKLYFFSTSQSWTGSEIPLINEKISFIYKLKDELHGIEFIEHVMYLQEKISDEEKYKEQVELEEYIENAIYA